MHQGQSWRLPTTDLISRIPWLVAALASAVCANAQLPEGGLALYDVGREDLAQQAHLLNRDECSLVRFGETTYLQLKDDPDPYSKIQWLFQWSAPPVIADESFCLEVEYHDTGMGVIQPEMLVDDRFHGQWSGPLRQQAYTRLNTGNERRAFLAFAAADCIAQATRGFRLMVYRFHDAMV